MFTGEIVDCVARQGIPANPDAAHFSRQHVHGFGYTASLIHCAQAPTLFTSIATMFTTMLKETAISQFLLANPDRKVVASSGLGSNPPGGFFQGRSVVSVQPTHLLTAELTVDDGKGLRKLPDEVLAIVAAAASESLEEALPLLSALTAGRGDKPASPSLAVRVMFQSNPRLDREFGRQQLLQQFRPREALQEPFGDLHQAMLSLEGQALKAGHPPDEVLAWLLSERTIGALIAKAPRWMNQLEASRRTEGVLLAYLDAGGHLDAVPPKGRNDPYWLVKTSGPQSRPQDLQGVPSQYRTQALLCAAVAKHPTAYAYVHYKEMSLKILRIVYGPRVGN